MKRQLAFLLATLFALVSSCLAWHSDSAQAGGMPVEFDFSLKQSTLTVGDPLVLEMQVTNTSSDVLERFTIGSSDFWLIWYSGSTEEGCELAIYVATPPWPLPERFGFHWDILGFEPGDTKTCRVTFPQTLFAGQDTISLSGYTLIDDEHVVYDLAEFTYTLLPPSGAPVIIDVGLEHPVVFAGEPLIVDMRVTNLSSDVIGSLSVASSEFSLIGYEDYTVEGCALDITDSDPPGFGFDWGISELGPGEIASCRVIFPQTLEPGTDEIHLSSVVDDEVWENGAAFGYQLLPPTEPPIEVEVDLEQSTLRVGEPLIFDMRVTNISPEPLTPFSIVGQPFFLTDFFPTYTEGCTLWAEWWLHGWPLWEQENLREGFVFYWDVPALQPGETASCRVTLPNTLHTGQDTIGLSTWIDSPPWTPWRNLAQFNYTLLPADTIFHDRFE